MPKVRLGSQLHGAQAELPVHESAVPKASTPSSLWATATAHYPLHAALVLASFFGYASYIFNLSFVLGLYCGVVLRYPAFLFGELCVRTVMQVGTLLTSAHSACCLMVTEQYKVLFNYGSCRDYSFHLI